MRRFDLGMAERQNGRGFMLRIEDKDALIERFAAEAMGSGEVLTDRLANPNAEQATEFDRTAGLTGSSAQAIESAIRRWMPAVRSDAAHTLADGFAALCLAQTRAGKSETIVRNMLAKMMIWLRYATPRTVKALGGSRAPKILARRFSGRHDVQYLRVLAEAGADVLVSFIPSRPVPEIVAINTEAAEVENEPHPSDAHASDTFPKGEGLGTKTVRHSGNTKMAKAGNEPHPSDAHASDTFPKGEGLGTKAYGHSVNMKMAKAGNEPHPSDAHASDTFPRGEGFGRTAPKADTTGVSGLHPSLTLNPTLKETIAPKTDVASPTGVSSLRPSLTLNPTLKETIAPNTNTASPTGVSGLRPSLTLNPTPNETITPRLTLTPDPATAQPTSVSGLSTPQTQPIGVSETTTPQTQPTGVSGLTTSPSQPLGVSGLKPRLTLDVSGVADVHLIPDPTAPQPAPYVPTGNRYADVRDPNMPTGKLFRLPDGTLSPYVSALALPENAAPDRALGPELARYLTRPVRVNNTNAWLPAVEPENALTPPSSRENTPGNWNNIFYRQYGVRDRLTFANSLFELRTKLEGTGRPMLVIEGRTEVPSPDEIARVRHRNYRTVNEMIIDLSMNLRIKDDDELESELIRAFAETVTRASYTEKNLNRLRVSAVTLAAWLLRWRGTLFPAKRRRGDLAVVIKLGGCGDEREAMLYEALSLLPADVLLFVPDRDRPCCLEAPFLKERSFAESLALEKFPSMNGVSQVRTAASEARGELDRAMYGTDGLYRGELLTQAESAVLRTTAEEIDVLWNTELRLRPGFASDGARAKLPVLFAKLCGVPENRDPLAYWRGIAAKRSDETLLYSALPLPCASPETFARLSVDALRGGVLQKDRLRAHPSYPFARLRKEMEEHLLDKLSWMLDRRVAAGTFVNGTEHAVIAAVLSISPEWLRLAQDFDFSKKNPKLVVVAAGEESMSRDDAIRLAFASLIGFDVLLYVPTGYQTAERWLDGYAPVEHRIGPFRYDLQVPDLNALPPESMIAKFGKLLRRK